MKTKLSMLQITALSAIALTGCGGSGSGGGSGSADAISAASNSSQPFVLQPSSPAGAINRARSAKTNPHDPSSMFVTHDTTAGVQLRRLDVSAGAADLASVDPVTIPGTAGQTAVSEINFADPRRASLAIADPGAGTNPRVALFNPAAAQLSTAFEVVDLSNPDLLEITAPANTFNSANAPISGYRVDSPVDSVILTSTQGPQLFVAFANRSDPGLQNPGTVCAYDLSTENGQTVVRLAATIVSRAFNPTELRLVHNAQGAQLLLASSGVVDPSTSTRQPAGVEIIDVATLRVTGEIILESAEFLSALSVSDDASTAFIATTTPNQDARIFEIDLATLQTGASHTLPYRLFNAQASVGIESSASGDALYVLIPGDRILYTLNRATGLVESRVDLTFNNSRSGAGTNIDLPISLTRRTNDADSTLFVLVSPINALLARSLGQSATIDVLSPTVR